MTSVDFQFVFAKTDSKIAKSFEFVKIIHYYSILFNRVLNPDFQELCQAGRSLRRIETGPR